MSELILKLHIFHIIYIVRTIKLQIMYINIQILQFHYHSEQIE